jgi:glycosyltransferase involved in cell wall biosynthesis
MQEQVEIPRWIHYHGPVTPAELANSWYPKATGMITLSLHDEGRPQVLLEAMAAGLPVLCSRTPAHADLCEANRLGPLVSTREEFLAALQLLSDREASRRQGAHTRDHTGHAFGTWQDCARRYAAIHEELAGESARCA